MATMPKGSLIVLDSTSSPDLFAATRRRGAHKDGSETCGSAVAAFVSDLSEHSTQGSALKQQHNTAKIF